MCDKCGEPMVIKTGRFGRFIACSNFPACKNTRQVPPEGSSSDSQDQNSDSREPETTDEVCEKCGQPMVIKSGRFGRFPGLLRLSQVQKTADR